MSLNVPPVHVASVMDPRLEIKPREYVALKGAAVSSWQVFPANSSSTSSVQVTCNPPSRATAINRIVWQRATFDISITGTNTTGGPLLVDGYHAPRAMPLTMVSNACQVTFGNTTVTQSPLQQFWGALMWLGDNDYANRFGQYSLAPSMLDQAQSYDELALTPRNPLGQYSDNPFEIGRGGYVGYRVISNANGATGATLQLTTIEPILLSPLVSGPNSNFVSCLSGLQNMSYQLNFGDLRRILSLTPDQGTGGAINIQSSGINVSVNNFSLIFNYLTPDPLYPIPTSIQSSYFQLTPYVSEYGSSVAPGETITLPFNSIQLASIPRRLIIFARERDQNRTAFTPDTYLALPSGVNNASSNGFAVNPLAMVYDNRNFFNTATTENLYDIAVKNGCQMSYTQYTRDVGSIIILDAGVDFGVGSDEAPGVLKNVQLAVTCQFTNTSSRTLNVQGFIIAVEEGVMNINNGSADLRIGVLSNQDVLNSTRVPGVTYKRQTDVYGGNFFNSLKNALSGAHKFIRDNKIVSTALGAFPHPAVQAASSLARELGYGGSGMRGRGGDLFGKIEKKRNKKVKSNETLSSKMRKVCLNKNVIDASDLAEDNDIEYISDIDDLDIF